MSAFRWIILRLFWSLLALIPAAFFVLWAVHAYALPQSNVLDEMLVVLLEAALFAIANYVLTREGERRFNFLQERGRALLADPPTVRAPSLVIEPPRRIRSVPWPFWPMMLVPGVAVGVAIALLSTCKVPPLRISNVPLSAAA